MKFLNNFLLNFTTENEQLVDILLIPSSFIELYLVVSLFASILDTTIPKTKKAICVSILAIITVILNYLCETPYNILITYTVTFFVMLFFFKLKPIPTLFGILISLVSFTLVGSLVLNPFLKVFNITFNKAETIPIYRILYLSITYIIIFIISYFIKNFRFCFKLFDKLDHVNRAILYFNSILGLFTFFGQTFFLFCYVDTLSITYTIFTFILLIAYFSLSMCSVTRIAKLMNTTLALQSAEQYNKSLSILYDNVKGFKHDFDNIVSTINGYVQTDDMDGLKDYFIRFQKDCQRTNNIATLNPNIINNPGIYSLLSSKYHKADALGIQINLDFFVDLNEFNIDIYEFSRILGILLDNAIEASNECENKIINIKFRNELNNSRHVIIVSNTYKDKDINIDSIFDKGQTSKSNHCGLGLYEVREYIKKNKNLNMFTTKDNTFFTQQFEIYYSTNNLLCIK